MFKTFWLGINLVSHLIKKIDGSVYLVGAGLILGLVFGMMMSFSPKSDFGFDQNDQRLMQLTVSNQKLARTKNLAKTLKSTFQEIEHVTAVAPAENSSNSWSRGLLSSSPNEGNQMFASSHFVDKNFFKTFPFDFIQSAVFLDENSIFLSEDIALRIFDTTIGVIGRTVRWKNDTNEGEYIVSGIFHPTSLVSTDQFEVLFSMDLYNTLLTNEAFAPQILSTYVMLKHGTDTKKINTKIESFISNRNAEKDNSLFARGADAVYAQSWPSNSK